jgi:hypothetical protein
VCVSNHSLQLVCLSPSLILSVLAAGVTGYAIFPFFRSLESGLPEMAILLGVYALSGRSTTKSWFATLLPPIVAYAFAWIGHFYIEGNKPATFIYPAYSLFGRAPALPGLPFVTYCDPWLQETFVCFMMLQLAQTACTCNCVDSLVNTVRNSV